MGDGNFSAHEQLFLQKVSEASAAAAAKAVAEALKQDGDKYADFFRGITSETHIAHHNSIQNRGWDEIKKQLIIWAIKGIIMASLIGLVFWFREMIIK